MKTSVAVLFSAALLLLNPQATLAASWNLESDFSTTSNPDAPWTFFTLPKGIIAPHQHVSLLPMDTFHASNIPFPFDAWYQSTGPAFPTGALVGKNTGGVFLIPDNDNTVVGFSLPGGPTTVNFTVDVRDGDPNTQIDGQTFTIFHNDTKLAEQILLIDDPNTYHWSFSDVVLNPGDSLYFINDRFNQLLGDAIFLDVSITQVPVPAMASVFGAALCWLVTGYRRKS